MARTRTFDSLPLVYSGRFKSHCAKWVAWYLHTPEGRATEHGLYLRPIPFALSIWLRGLSLHGQ